MKKKAPILSRSDLVEMWGSEDDFRKAKMVGEIPPATIPPRKGKKGQEAQWDLREMFKIKAQSELSESDKKNLDDDVKLARLVLRRIYRRFSLDDIREGTDILDLSFEIGSLFGNVLFLAINQVQIEERRKIHKREIDLLRGNLSTFTEELKRGKR